MSWYYGTYACGHEGRVNIVGPTKEREWKVNREFSALCPDCCEAELQRKNKEAAKTSQEMELPLLIGTEKQVAWANTIRLSVIEKIELEIKTNITKNIEIAWASLDHGLKEHTDARYWIDNRSSVMSVFKEFVREYHVASENAIPPSVKKDIEEEEANLTAKPENPKHDGVVVLKTLLNGNLGASYVKNDNFKKIVYDKFFRWDQEKSIWSHAINEYSGPIDERAADIGNALLSNGFTVQFMNALQLEKATSGIFSRECKRWVKFSQKNNTLAISWDDTNNALYTAAKKLSGAKWNNGSMHVPLEYYKQVQDFAETLEFSFSCAALDAINAYIDKESTYLVKSISNSKTEEISDDERIRKSLESSGTIIGDLLDES